MDEEIELTTVDGQAVRVALSGAVAAVGRAVRGSGYSVKFDDGSWVDVRRDATQATSWPNGRAEALIKAIRAITVDLPGDEPNGEAERQLLRLEATLGRVVSKVAGDERVSRYAYQAADAAARLCEAIADDTRALRLAAEAYFGGDFGAPDAPGPDMLDPETPEAAVEACARKMGLDPDALRRRGEEFVRQLKSQRGDA